MKKMLLICLMMLTITCISCESENETVEKDGEYVDNGNSIVFSDEEIGDAYDANEKRLVFSITQDSKDYSIILDSQYLIDNVQSEKANYYEFVLSDGLPYAIQDNETPEYCLVCLLYDIDNDILCDRLLCTTGYQIPT